MSELDILVENYFAPKSKTLTKQMLYEIFDESLKELKLAADPTGQQSERNLVDSINRLVEESGNGLNLSLGEFGLFTVTGAASLAGGNPEPKADIVIYTDDIEKPEIGLSMKKENFAFFQNWMDKKKLKSELSQVGLDDFEADILINEIIRDLADLTARMEEVITAEKEEFIRIATGAKPDYNFPDKITPEILEALESSEKFSSNGKFRNRFKISNYYAKISDILEGDKYLSMLKLIMGGAAGNPRKADGVLIADILPNASLEETQKSLNKIITIDSAVKRYASDEKINIKFRLRPMTLVRTTYSTTNRGKYKVGQRLYEDPRLGVSWTVSVTK